MRINPAGGLLYSQGTLKINKRLQYMCQVCPHPDCRQFTFLWVTCAAATVDNPPGISSHGGMGDYTAVNVGLSPSSNPPALSKQRLFVVVYKVGGM